MLGGTVYASGIGVHAESVLVYEVRPEYRRFVAVAGIDDEKKDSVASMVFKVITEVGGLKKEIAASPKLLAQRQPARWYFDVAIPDQCTRLRLVVEDAGAGINSDHADWVDAGFMTGN
jgi:alpha-galactosidase